MKHKFIEANEIVKPGKNSYTYVGVELERNKESVSILCVGGGDWEDISVEEFALSQYKIKPADKDRVHHLFTVALKEKCVDFMNAEKALLKAKRNLVFHQNKIKQFFGKPIEAKASEELVEF